MEGAYEHGIEPSCAIKGRVYFHLLSEYYLVKKDSAPWS